MFGCIRADALHLQVEARRARTGSARLAGIGDVGAWEGDQLVVSGEVKSFVVEEGIVADLVRIVSLWNPLKQRAALNAFQWAVIHRERNVPLIQRAAAFSEAAGHRQPVAVAAAPAGAPEEDGA